jgi:hypothetical protein
MSKGAIGAFLRHAAACEKSMPDRTGPLQPDNTVPEPLVPTDLLLISW